ncbi:universal stress protein [Halococcus qingdaonensis]|uniref:universal stress protein n=1 Tax=Halococcus qingdaonensis TaxID=224402 RepID=UPI002116C1ED|nr:universal stress protein [Halococcus qingdaonensis]
MFETVVIATDGSESAGRAVTAALDLADRFDAAVHALYVVEEDDVAAAPEDVRDRLRSSLEESGEAAVESVQAVDASVTTAVREGQPTEEIQRYADDHDADLVATGTRGRHGEYRFVLGSVAEALVRNLSVPVLTVRQLNEAAD